MTITSEVGTPLADEVTDFFARVKLTVGTATVEPREVTRRTTQQVGEHERHELMSKYVVEAVRGHARLAGKTAAVAVLTIGVGALVAASPAQAEPAYLSMSASIRMAVSDSRTSPDGNYLEQVVYVDGLVSMSQAAAQDTINHGGDLFALRYWGDDTNDDDLLAGPLTPTTTFAAPDGLHFERATR